VPCNQNGAPSIKNLHLEYIRSLSVALQARAALTSGAADAPPR